MSTVYSPALEQIVRIVEVFVLLHGVVFFIPDTVRSERSPTSQVRVAFPFMQLIVTVGLGAFAVTEKRLHY